MNEIPHRTEVLDARHLLEAETAKDFIARAASGELENRRQQRLAAKYREQRRASGREHRRLTRGAYYRLQEPELQELPAGFPQSPRWRKLDTLQPTFRRKADSRNTYYYKFKGHEPRHTLRFHQTDVLTWKADGSVVCNNAGFFTKTTKERMNDMLPNGWRIAVFLGNWYWHNQRWPWDQLPSASRGRGHFRITYTNGDWIDREGNLHCNFGTINAERQVVPGPFNVQPPANAPQQEAIELADRLLEGSYHRDLDRRRRIEAKFKKIRQVEKLKRYLERIDQPGKRKKKLNLH